ncbi:alpha/beta hydrolase [Pectinatus sottacetonis]|uniref:alpha/beta hydrolase n=1 Tax=Pectinatus sottacetonis TaxID=1002795 RepID=UPI0018C4AA87|nr:alpha/beta fold hydrolase [Pectinatus sottacetonis]
MILNGAEPFWLNGNKHGILLVHGFTGSPSEMSLLGKYLNHLGYTVMAVRLCGHGTTPEDIERTTWKDWYHSVCDAYYLLKDSCEDVCVIGLSMGGALSLLLSLDFPIQKVVSLSTPVFISSERGLDLLPPRKYSAGLYIPKAHRKFATNIGYNKMSLAAVHELLDCIQSLKNNLHKIRLPVLIVQSNNDHTVNAESGKYIYDNIKSHHKQLLQLKKSGHLVTLDIEKEFVFDKIKIFLTTD